MDIEEYIKDRLDDQINWYDTKSQIHQKWYKILKVSEFKKSTKNSSLPFEFNILFK